MQFPKDQHAAIALHIVLVVVAVVVGMLVTHFRERAVVHELEVRIDAYHERMFELAEITDRNAADKALAAIITDCPRRSEYEAALIQLGKLSKKDLITAQNLHESCGSFFAEQKALMVQKLTREFEIYSELVGLYQLYVQGDDSHRITQWKELLAAEQARATLLGDLDGIQGQIITKLISGSNPQGEEIQKLVQEAQQMSELLSVHDSRSDALRKELANL